MTSAPDGHRLDRQCRRGPQLLATVRRRPILLDLDHDATLRAEIGEEARLVLEAALADDVELRVVAHRSLDKTRERGALELGEVFAGEIGDEVRGRVDRVPVDSIACLGTVAAGRASLPVRPPDRRATPRTR